MAFLAACVVVGFWAFPLSRVSGVYCDVCVTATQQWISVIVNTIPVADAACWLGVVYAVASHPSDAAFFATARTYLLDDPRRACLLTLWVPFVTAVLIAAAATLQHHQRHWFLYSLLYGELVGLFWIGVMVRLYGNRIRSCVHGMMAEALLEICRDAKQMPAEPVPHKERDMV